MDDGRAALLRLHHPAESYRVRFGHRRAFDQNAIGVCEILLRGRSSAAAEGGAQTGHRAAMSYPRLVGHTDHVQAASEEFFYEIIFFVVEGGAAEMADRSRMIDGCAVLLSNEGALTRFPDAVRHHLHRTIHRNFRPLFRARCAVFYFRFTLRMREQLIRRRTLWTKIPLTDRTFRIAFDGNQFAVFVINELTATDTAIWADRARNLCVIDPSVHRTRLVRHRLEAGAILALANLPNEWPFRKQRKHNLHPSLRGWNGSQSLENVIVQRARPAETNAQRVSH